MSLVKLSLTGEKASYGMWVNSAHVLEVVEGRESDYVKMVGTGNSGTYTIGVESAAATAKAIQEAESYQPYRLHP
jgi:hypothetical protein